MTPWCVSCSGTSYCPYSWSSCTLPASCTPSFLWSGAARTSASVHPSHDMTCSWTCGSAPWCCHSRPSARTSGLQSSLSHRSSSCRSHGTVTWGPLTITVHYSLFRLKWEQMISHGIIPVLYCTAWPKVCELILSLSWLSVCAVGISLISEMGKWYIKRTVGKQTN